MLPKSFGCESVLSRVVTQVGQIEFRNAGRIDQYIDGEIAILCPGEFVD